MYCCHLELGLGLVTINVSINVNITNTHRVLLVALRWCCSVSVPISGAIMSKAKKSKKQAQNNVLRTR